MNNKNRKLGVSESDELVPSEDSEGLNEELARDAESSGSSTKRKYGNITNSNDQIKKKYLYY